MHQPHGRENVQPVHLVLAVQGNGKEAPDNAESGVVDQEFKIWRGGDAIFDGLQIRIACEIRGQDFSLHGMVLLDGAGLLLQPVSAPRNQNQVVAALGQLTGESGADTARSAGNQGQGTRLLHGSHGSS